MATNKPLGIKSKKGNCTNFDKQGFTQRITDFLESDIVRILSINCHTEDRRDDVSEIILSAAKRLKLPICDKYSDERVMKVGLKFFCLDLE